MHFFTHPEIQLCLAIKGDNLVQHTCVIHKQEDYYFDVSFQFNMSLIKVSLILFIIWPYFGDYAPN